MQIFPGLKKPQQAYDRATYNYSRVHISSDTAFLKILKEPSIEHE